MKLTRRWPYATLATAALFTGIATGVPASAQNDTAAPLHVRAIIQTMAGKQAFDVDLNRLPWLGQGDEVTVGVDTAGGHSEIYGGPELLLAVSDGYFKLKGSDQSTAGAYNGLNIIDPRVSYIGALLYRIDVGQEIHLNARQREALDATESNQQAVRGQPSGEMDGLRNLINNGHLSLLQPYAWRIVRLHQDSQMQHMKKLAAILKPEQLVRLMQLDLQYRGPMALSVDDVADRASLTPELAARIGDVFTVYRQEINRCLGFGARFEPGRQGSAGAALTSPALNAEELRGNAVKADRDIRVARITLSARALALLSAQQQSRWFRLTGKRFEFHPEL